MSATFYFATEREFIPPFEKSEEGIHLELSIEELNNVFNGLRDKKFIYQIEGPDVKPCYIDEDILLWNGPNLADLFLDKYYGQSYAAAFENQADITPEQVHINIEEKDLDTLEEIANMDSDEMSFGKIMRFLKSKGYNCISYLIYEGDRVNDRAVVVPNNFNFNYSTLKRLK